MTLRLPRSAPALGLALLAAALAGCSADPTRGYSLSSTFDGSVHTIAVPVFANETYSSGLEMRLTEAIVKQLRQTTPWRVVGSESAATTLQGSIDDVEMIRLSRQRDTGLAQEQGLRVTVSFDWIDNRTGQTRVSRRRFAAIASFVPHHGVGEPIEIGENAVIEELARDIVSELRSDW